MERPIIRRLARTDGISQALLVSITRNGAHPLDLKLVATDQEHLYHGALRDNAIKSLQTSNYSGDLGEWKDILSHVLLQTRPKNDSELFVGLEAVAAITRSVVTITIRKKVGSITQRLGEIKLDEDDEREEIAAFEWVDAAVATSDDLCGQLETLQSSVTQHQETVAKLTAQLDELIQAKKAHEEELLSKFASLLNAKKLKIRDQQYLLSRAKVDPDAALDSQRARGAPSQEPRTRARRQPGESARNKRKAKEEIVPGSDEEMDDADEQNIADDVHSDDEQRMETPEDSDATEDEDEFEPNIANQPTSLNTGNTVSHTQDEPAVQTSIEKPPPPPPRRGLPFRRKSAQESSARSSGGADDDDDDETDDEL
jgi:hypothetical protein